MPKKSGAAASPAERGTFTPAEPLTPIPDLLARSLAPGASLDQPRMPGRLPAEAGDPALIPKAAYTDVSVPKPPDPRLGAHSSPPAAMDRLPHLAPKKG